MTHRAVLHRHQHGSEVDGLHPHPGEVGQTSRVRVSFTGVFPETGGTVTRDERLDKPGNVRREIHVQRHGDGIVTIMLPATTDCDAQDAIRTSDGRKLSNRDELTVGGPGG